MRPKYNIHYTYLCLSCICWIVSGSGCLKVSGSKKATIAVATPRVPIVIYGKYL